MNESQMHCSINWEPMDLKTWNVKFQKIRRANLLQSYAYARAMSEVKSLKPRWGIIEIEGKEAGLLQVFETGLLGKLIHALILDRGPLWFEGFGDKDHQAAFYKAFNRQFPKRFGRKRRIIPETDLDIEPHGFTKTGKGYETIWLDLTKPQDTLLKELRKNWRGTLNKAQKEDLTIEWDENGKQWPWLLSSYMVDRETKGYDGPSVKLITALAKYAKANGDLLIGRALKKDKPVAGIMLLKHGKSATYQIGFSDDMGRKTGAHNLLLWEAVLLLQENGYKDFDLGGINDESAKGVKKFKTGLGGEITSLVGIYS